MSFSGPEKSSLSLLRPSAPLSVMSFSSASVSSLMFTSFTSVSGMSGMRSGTPAFAGTAEVAGWDVLLAVLLCASRGLHIWAAAHENSDQALKWYQFKGEVPKS